MHNFTFPYPLLTLKNEFWTYILSIWQSKWYSFTVLLHFFTFLLFHGNWHWMSIILMNNLIQFLSHLLLLTCCQRYSVWNLDSCNELYTLYWFLTPWFNLDGKTVKFTWMKLYSSGRCFNNMTYRKKKSIS